jgi:hypothetical protein
MLGLSCPVGKKIEPGALGLRLYLENGCIFDKKIARR